MFEQIINSGGFMLSRNVIQKDPGVIVGPITEVFGYMLNFFFNMATAILPTEAHTLGLSIILLTIVAKLIMLPLGIKSQKSMAAMQKLQPEMERIKKKYGDSKDPEIQRRMTVETQELYSKNKANPFMGCLPLFIQFPIFMGMYYIMNQSYKFIDMLGSIYSDIARMVMSVPGYYNFVYDIGFSKVPRGMEISLVEESGIVKVLSKFVQDDWAALLSQLPADTAVNVQAILDRKYAIETFLSINLTETVGLYWPAILIPIAAVITSFLTSYLSNKQSKSTDPAMKTQQTMMMVMMPVMMGFITIGMPGGVGLYWIVSNIFQVIQQIALNKVFNKPDETGEIIDPKPDKTVNNKARSKSSKK